MVGSAQGLPTFTTNERTYIHPFSYHARTHTPRTKKKEKTKNQVFKLLNRLCLLSRLDTFMKVLVGLRSPDVPGFCPSIGDVDTAVTASAPKPSHPDVAAPKTPTIPEDRSNQMERATGTSNDDGNIAAKGTNGGEDGAHGRNARREKKKKKDGSERKERSKVTARGGWY